MKIFRKILWLTILCVLLLATFAFGYYYAVTKNTALHPEKLLFNEKSVIIYDGTGKEIHGVGYSVFKQATKIEDIPLYVRQAFIDTEDKRFYQHHGFDYKRIIGASINNVKSRSFKEGASTISQQLIKNTHLSQEKTVKRKLQERKLTRILEKKYSKNEILERYLNTIYFGHNCFGITSAANFYFAKSPAELSLSDGAILAALVKAPNYYSPFRNPEKCRNRKACVLNLMYKNGSIDDTARQNALRENLPANPTQSQSHDYLHFVFEELSEIAERQNCKLGGKIEIRTYLDPQVQATLEEVTKQHEDSDKSIFVLDNASCGFKACISSVGNIPRLPGSLIKPLLVYAPAMDKDLLSPATPILDEKINYSGYAPENYGGKYHGYISARECVEKSLNIPAVKVLESLGLNNACTYMEKLGLRVDEDEKNLALALGGMKKGYFLKDLTAAYATFANDGIYQSGSFINEVTINGVQVYKRKKTPTQVFSKSTACLMTDILKGTATRGTAKKLRVLPFEIAAKTGTVGTENGNTDAYSLSYTTRDCVGVWLGNTSNAKISYTGGGEPCNIALKIHQGLSENYQKQNIKINPFILSEDLKRVVLDKASYENKQLLLRADPNAPVERTFTELFKQSQIPLQQSDSFTKPSILPPTLSVKENGVEIRFPTDIPDYYSYHILRVNYDTHTTQIIYDGKKIERFFDDNLEKGKTYQYFVVPIFQQYKGEKIALPTVIAEIDEIKLQLDKILDKKWWEY